MKKIFFSLVMMVALAILIEATQRGLLFFISAMLIAKGIDLLFPKAGEWIKNNY